MQYSNDLRRKRIEAWESNYDTQQELADQFGVSLGWVEKVLRRWHDTGHSEAPEFRPGPQSSISPPLAWKSSSCNTPTPPWRNSQAVCR
jgi:transposase